MKKIIISILCLGMALSAYAQSTSSGESSSSRKNAGRDFIGNTNAPQPYHKVMFTYSPFLLKVTDGEQTGRYYGSEGMGITYMHGSPLDKFPLYLEYGGGLHYTYCAGGGDIVSVDIPLNLLYRFAFNGGIIHLAPYAGLYGRLNVWNNAEMEDMKRVQFGWQAGAQFDVRKFYLHIAYVSDITSVFTHDHNKYVFGGVNFGIGVIF